MGKKCFLVGSVNNVIVWESIILVAIMLSGQILTYKEWEGEVGYEIPVTLMRGALKI